MRDSIVNVDRFKVYRVRSGISQTTKEPCLRIAVIVSPFIHFGIFVNVFDFILGNFSYSKNV